MSVDCDDVTLLLAARNQRTLTDLEETHMRGHLETCAVCNELVGEAADQWRWIVRVPADALDRDELDDLPTVDPAVFAPKGEIAAGGMGRITRVRDRRLGRDIAVKESLDHQARDRFEREVRITARLQHRAIVSIYEAGVFPDGTSFYAMPILPGKTLQEAIESAPTLAERLRLVPYLRTVVDAIAYAHANNIVHRDLKPANILVGEFGEAVVIDWGLAKDLGGGPTDDTLEDDDGSNEPGITRAGTIMGTPCYMSPEQAAGKESTPQDDVYALGAIMYTLLAGAPPYWDTTAHDPESLVTETRSVPPSPLTALAADAPADLRAIVERAMSRSAEDRFRSARELADELARFEAGQLLASREYSLGELVRRWLRKHRKAATLTGLGVITAALLLVLWVRYRHATDQLALRERGSQITALYSDVARQAYRIDRDLLRMEVGLEGLAAASAWALTGPEPAGEITQYFDVDYAAGKRPDDFTKLPTDTAYRWPVSVDYPVISVAPGVDRAPLLPTIRRLAPIARHIREMVLAAAVGETTKLDAQTARATLLARESPIDYAYVDLPAGVHMVWPGMANLRRDYDVRTASFFTTTVGTRGTRWGVPYIDSTTDRDGDDLVVPCTKGVWSPSGEFLGVAGVEMTVTKMVTTSMRMQTRRPLRTSLVDKDGKKIIDSSQAGKRFTASGRDEALVLSEFDIPEIAAAIRGHTEGVKQIDRDGHAIMVAFVRLDAINWYYVVEVDAATLGT